MKTVMEVVMNECPKNDSDKIRFSLLPIRPLIELVKNFTQGAVKNGVRSWEKGMAWSRAFDAIQRHCWEWLNGEDYDKETGIHHMACVAFWALALMEYSFTNVGQDDRPKFQTGEKFTQDCCTMSIPCDSFYDEKIEPKEVTEES